MQNWYLGSDKKKRNVNNGFKVVNLNHLKKKNQKGTERKMINLLSDNRNLKQHRKTPQKTSL